MNDFEKPFRDALTDLEVAPPEGGWPPIADALDRKGFDYRTYGLLLLLLLLMGVGSLVTYHVTTHALEQQRVDVTMERTDASDGLSPATSPSSVVHTVEVPCTHPTPGMDVPADATAGQTAGHRQAMPDPRVEAACTPAEDAGNAAQHRAGVVHTSEDAVDETPEASRRVIRRTPTTEGTTITQRSQHTNAVVHTSDDDTSRRWEARERAKDADGSSTRKRPRTVSVPRVGDDHPVRPSSTTATQALQTPREALAGTRNSEHATDTVYARAARVKSPTTVTVTPEVILADRSTQATERKPAEDAPRAAGRRADLREASPYAANESALARGNNTGREKEHAQDSVVRAYNGPPMPARKRGNTPAFESLALVPVEKMEDLRQEKKPEKESPRDSVDEKKKDDRERSPWSLQVFGGVNYTFKQMDPARDLYYVTGLTNKNQPSWQNGGYQFGATARYQLAQRTTLTAGVAWNMLREHTAYNYYNIIADSVEVRQVVGKSIEVNGYSKVRTNDVTNTIHYLGVHVGVIQQVTFLRHARHIMLGLNVNRQIADTHHTENPDHRFTVNNLRVAVRLGLEHRVPLSPHHVLTLTPFFEQTFGSVYSKESVYTLQPMQLGLDVGLVLPFYKKR